MTTRSENFVSSCRTSSLGMGVRRPWGCAVAVGCVPPLVFAATLQPCGFSIDKFEGCRVARVLRGVCDPMQRCNPDGQKLVVVTRQRVLADPNLGGTPRTALVVLQVALVDRGLDAPPGGALVIEIETSPDRRHRRALEP